MVEQEALFTVGSKKWQAQNSHIDFVNYNRTNRKVGLISYTSRAKWNIPTFSSCPHTSPKSLDEILSRANQGGVDQIEMAARESTSYRLLTSDFGKRLLARRGYSVEDFGVEDVFDEDESTHLLRLTKTT